MNQSKVLIFGSAAVLAVIGDATAADLPVKAKAIEYVKICSAYGAGNRRGATPPCRDIDRRTWSAFSFTT
jgi:hypothetical protein